MKKIKKKSSKEIFYIAYDCYCRHTGLWETELKKFKKEEEAVEYLNCLRDDPLEDHKNFIGPLVEA